MANVLFLTNEWTELATLVSATTSTGSDANNLLTLDPREFWLSNSATASHFQFSRATTPPLVDTFFLGYGKETINGAFQIRGFTPPQTLGSPEFDSGVRTFHLGAAASSGVRSKR